MSKKLVVNNLVALVCIFLLSPAMVFAQPAWCDANNPTCEGDFNCDCDVDGSDAAQFKSDFGRGQFKTPCPTCSSSNAELEARVAYLEALLANVTRVMEQGQDTIRFSGVNVQIVNGSGTTDGPVNGRGNLIVGYNELRGVGDDRTGSHNIVVGFRNNYSSFGGLVAGFDNTISGPYASVSGGGLNTASGLGASVSGGYSNTASVIYASVSGGQYNEASGLCASVSGGRYNQAIGNYSFVGGGGSTNPVWANYAVGEYSAILGGADNTAGDPNRVDTTIGQWSTVSGGRDNIASGNYSSVSGGRGGTAAGFDDWVAGGLWQDE